MYLTAWFKVRQDGKYISPPLLPPGADSDDPALGWIPLDSFSTFTTNILDSFGPTTKPSAAQFVATVDLFSDTTYDLYLDESSSLPAKGTDLVDLNQYGLQKENPIILQVKKDDQGGAGDSSTSNKTRNKNNGDDSDSDNSDA